jgi:hypothetical protein
LTGGRREQWRWLEFIRELEFNQLALFFCHSIDASRRATSSALCALSLIHPATSQPRIKPCGLSLVNIKFDLGQNGYD